MTIKTSFIYAEAYLHVKCVGQWDPWAVRETLMAIRLVAEKRDYVHILVDVCKLSAPSSDYQCFQAGKDLAELLGFPMRIASVYTSEWINGVGEMAVIAGACIQVFDQMEAAIAWLLPCHERPVLEADEMCIH